MERPLDCRTAHLDDATLLQRLHALLARDHRTSAMLLAHLGEVEARGLHRDAGYSSLFGYCTGALHMSESEAALRIRAARLARQYPEVLNHVERGELHLSALRVLAPVLDDNNHTQLLRSAMHKTKAEVEALVAELAPKPDAPQLVRKLPTPKLAGVSDATKPDLLSCLPNVTPAASMPFVAPPLRPAARPVAAPVTPLGQERYRIQLTASQALHDKLKQAQELLRHRVPSGDVATVVELALDRLVRDLKKERFAQTVRPRTSRATRNPDSRHIPAAVRREVAERDGEQCTFVSADGRRCTETGMLEFDHQQAFARGGLSTPDNVRLLCRAHNRLHAERTFGRAFMQQARARRDSAQQTLWLVPEPVRLSTPSVGVRVDQFCSLKTPRGEVAGFELEVDPPSN
jgi:5-methylcytosine-specific restriction endonuclease McrA